MSGLTNHAQLRAAERHDLELTYVEFDEICLAITDALLGLSRRATLLATLQDGTERWLVSIREKARRIVWNPEMARVVTVLPDKGKLRLHSFGRQRAEGRGRTERGVKEVWE